MPDTSNNVLVEAAQAGDADAFAVLVEKHYGMVHGLTYSKVGDWTISEDLTQDVFLIAWTNLSKLRHPEAFLVWLRQIARNAALNWIRRKQYRRKLTERHNAQNNGACSEPDPSGEAARHECIQHVGEALQTLSPKLREAMVMYYLEGHTAAASAEALGISVDTMKKRLRLGRAKMQRYYERRSVDNLEQLLPHRPKRPIENIVAGLAVGPVMPELGASITATGPAMWLGDLWHGASPAVLKAQAAPIIATTVASVKTTAAGAAIVFASAGAVGVLITTPLRPGDTHTEASAAESAPAIAHSTSPPVDTELHGALQQTHERYILVDQFIPEAGSIHNGLRKGDRIVKVNGRPLSTSILEDPRAFLYGHPGTRVTVTVMRPNENGVGEQELHFNILRPYQPHRFTADGNNP